jgi:hypothetical protein
MSEIFKPNLERNEKLTEETEKNIYNKEKFSPEEAKEHVESLINNFKDYYTSLGYQEVSSVQITSGIDSTVRFIGSHISVFKPYLAEERVPTPGVYMRQDCLRTRNVEKLLDDSFFPNWGSYFSSIGALSAPERLKEVCDEVSDFLEKKLLIAPENILIRISSTDGDLLDITRECYSERRMEIDSRKIEYYRHKIGMEGISGRNFNIALRNPDTEGFADIGNIIILEDGEKRLGIEIALGTSTILKQLHGLEHVQDCTPVIGLETIENQAIRRKFEDAIITSTVLYREGLRPFGQHNRNRILKQYVRSLSYFRGKTGMDIDQLQQIISNFENKEFQSPTEDLSAETIIEFVKAFENELFIKKELTDDEKKILDSLEQLKNNN